LEKKDFGQKRTQGQGWAVHKIVRENARRNIRKAREERGNSEKRKKKRCHFHQKFNVSGLYQKKGGGGRSIRTWKAKTWVNKWGPVES